MYIIRTVSKKNDVYIKDLNVTVFCNDKDGVQIDNYRFDTSKDAKIALEKNQIYVEKPEGDYSEVPDKNVIPTEKELEKFEKLYDNMTVYIKNYMNSGMTTLAIYDKANNKWNFIAGGSGNSSEGGSGYIHPLTHPATMIDQDETHRFVTDEQIEKWDSKSDFDGDYNNLKNKPTLPDMSNLSDVATSGDYNDLINKPSFATIATSGSYNDLTDKPEIPVFSSIAVSGDYNDLINKPEIPTLPVLAAVATSGAYNDLLGKPEIPTKISDLELDNVYTKEEVDNLTKGSGTGSISQDVIDKIDNLANVATSGDYLDLINTPEYAAVAATGSYTDLVNKPKIPEKVSDLNLDTVYTKDEINKKFSEISIAPGAGSVYKYQPAGSNNGECTVVASGLGVSVSKVSNKVTVTIPEGIVLVSLQFHFSESDIGAGSKVEIDYDSTATNSYDPIDFSMPQIQVINDVDGNRAMRQSISANYNINSHTVQVTGLLNNVACWVKLGF